MEKVFLLSGFNGSDKLIEDEKKLFDSLSKMDIDIDKIDYYNHYKSANSRDLIMDTTNELIRKYYENDCNPINIIGWSLGGCILVEVLNAISNINEQLDDKDKILIGKVMLFSPAWYIMDIKNFIKSHFSSDFYVSKEAEMINKKAEMVSVPYLLKNPLALWHLIKISSFSKKYTNYINSEKEASDGLSVLKQYDTLLVLPKNDAYVNVNKTLKKAKELGIEIQVINNYGHMALVVDDISQLIYSNIKNKVL